jgi:cobalt-zinc-cadmium efflux system outer membrane protein
MRGIHVLSLIVVVFITTTTGRAGDVVAWKAPFDTTSTTAASPADVLTFSDALQLTAATNPALKALAYERRAAGAGLKQAGLWSNPELEFEIEEFGLDAPGLKESEFTFSVSQEFDLFGQRGARKNLARAEIDATDLSTRIAAFDLYLEVKQRYYRLVHAQQQYQLAQSSVKLADDVVENIEYRVERGAALQSELLLAQLESQHSQLILDQADQELAVAASSLQTLWGGTSNEVTVTAETEPDFSAVIGSVKKILESVDSTRNIAQLLRQSEITKAERALSAAEARPGIGLSGGVKRFEGDNANSLLFGISLPLPLFNRNQGEREKLAAELRAIEYQIDGERTAARAELNALSIQLEQLLGRHESLDSLLIPTAEEAYETLQQSYESGRLPYTQLLEARRLLFDLNSEHNDLILAIQEQIIALESIAGVTIRIDKEN